MYTVFYTQWYCTLNKLQYSLNIPFTYSEKPKNSCDTSYCSGLEPKPQRLQGLTVCVNDEALT